MTNKIFDLIASGLLASYAGLTVASLCFALVAWSGFYAPSSALQNDVSNLLLASLVGLALVASTWRPKTIFSKTDAKWIALSGITSAALLIVFVW